MNQKANLTWLFCGALLCGFMMANSSLAQEGTSSRRVQNDEKRSELGERQRLVERKMVELEETFIVIAQRLKEKEPERAQRLIDAYQQAKEKLITREMAKVTELLDQDRLTDAGAQVDVVINNLDDLFRLLMNEKKKTASKKEEIQNLEKWKKAIKSLQQEQQRQVNETNKVANKDDTLKKLDAQLKQLNKLIKTQTAIAESTKNNSDSSIRELDKLADKQFDVRKQTEQLAKDIADNELPKGEKGKESDGEGKAGDGKPADGKEPQDGKSEDKKSNDGKTGDGKPKDGKSDEGKSGEGKSGEGKSGEGKSGEGKSGEGKSGEGKSGEGKSGDGKSGEQNQPQPGQKSLEKAAENQRRAEEKLGSGKAQEAKRKQDQAIDDLEKAMSELEKERRRIASLPPEAFDQMAQKQRRTRDKTLDVAKQMEKAPKGDQEAGGDQNANQQQSQQQPGQQQMQEAAESMKDAANDLDQQQAQNAERKQDKAEKELKKALDEIEERLNQLREETRAEKLARLEGRFREMLDRQQVVSIETIELDDKASNLGRLQRRDELVLLRLATEEMEIRELGQQAYDLLLEDGTSDVFPEVLQGLRDDLQAVATMLEEKRTDQLTQLLQKDIEGTLEELLEALKDAKKSGGGGGGGGGGAGKQPLLKKSHEYKILKFRQIRINQRTKQLDRIRNQQDQDQKPVDDRLEKEIDKTAEQQGKLLELTEDIMEEK